jgi:hypothetical protein
MRNRSGHASTHAFSEAIEQATHTILITYISKLSFDLFRTDPQAITRGGGLRQ